MVGAVNPQVSLLRERVEQRSRNNFDGMPRLILGLGLLVLQDALHLRIEVLKQGAAPVNVHELHPPADPKNGDLPAFCGSEQVQFRGGSLRHERAQFGMWRFTEKFRIDVKIAARQKKPVCGRDGLLQALRILRVRKEPRESAGL